VAGALRGQPRAGARRDRLGQPPDAGQRDREQHEQRDERQDARRGQQLDQRRRDEHAESQAAGAGDAVGKADADGVAPRMELKQRGAAGAEERARRQALEGAGDEQPHDGGCEDEAHGPRRAPRAA
jgi:hypothetical protein